MWTGMLRKVILEVKIICAVLDCSCEGKFWLKKLRINHGTKEVVVSTKEEINSKWMWLWSWLWNVIYMWIDEMYIFSLK
jgi:hypothetical protein